MKRILICEDEQDARESLKHILQRHNFEIYTVADGQEALNRMRQINPDVVLLDIRMPKIDGLELAQKIREFDTRVKLVMITA